MFNIVPLWQLQASVCATATKSLRPVLAKQQFSRVLFYLVLPAHHVTLISIILLSWYCIFPNPRVKAYLVICFQKNLPGMKQPHYVYKFWILPLSSPWYSIFYFLPSLEVIKKNFLLLKDLTSLDNYWWIEKQRWWDQVELSASSRAREHTILSIVCFISLL